MKDDPAQAMYAQRVKPLLRKTEPFAAAAILCTMAPLMLFGLYPPIFGIGGALAIMLGTISLARLKQSDEYQGNVVAVTAIGIGALELSGTLVVLWLF